MADNSTAGHLVASLWLPCSFPDHQVWRAGVVVAFQANQLPNPLVEVDVVGHPVYQAAAKQTLKPHFQTAEPARFQRLAADAMLTVRLFDDKAGRKKHLLGEAQLCCSHLQVNIHPFLPSC